MNKQQWINVIQHEWADSELNKTGIKIKQAAIKKLCDIPDDEYLKGDIILDLSHEINLLLLELYHNSKTNLYENVELIPSKQTNYSFKLDVLQNNIRRYNIYNDDDNCIEINYDLINDDNKEILFKILNKDNVFICNLPIVCYNGKYYNIPDNGIDLNTIYNYSLNNHDNIIILYQPNQNFDKFRMICINNNTGDLIAINN